MIDAGGVQAKDVWLQDWGRTGCMPAHVLRPPLACEVVALLGGTIEAAGLMQRYVRC
jgi:hypothetical protein